MKVEQLKIVIAEPSDMIRSGMSVLLKRIHGYRINPIEIHTADALKSYLMQHAVDILIVNPLGWGFIDIAKLKEDAGKHELKCMALIYTLIDQSTLNGYDETIGIYDSIEQLQQKIDKVVHLNTPELVDNTNALSAREKEIVICVVKGLTNKEIASELFLSAHTVISHRRNIARKLEIHSTSGLTIYAIMNKLIALEELKKYNML